VSGLVFSELAKALLQDHVGRDQDNGVTVVPVVCIGYAPGGANGDLLAAAIRAEEGNAVYAPEFAEGVEGALDGLAGSIEQFRDPDQPERPRLTVAEEKGVVKAAFTDGSSPPWSKGASTLVGGFLAPFSARLRRSSIALISYEETSLEGTSADALWQYYCLHLPQHDLGQLRTVVLFCYASTLVPSRHFQKFNAARFVVSPGKLALRRSWGVDRNEIRRLGEEATTPTVLFLAAGFSASTETPSGGFLPMGNELRDRALRRLIDDFDDEASAAATFRSFCSERGALLAGEEEMGELEFQRGLTLERVLQLELGETPDPLGPTLTDFRDEVEASRPGVGEALKILAELLDSGKRLVLLTVNFDELVEHCCGDLVQRFATETDFAAAPAFLDAYLRGEEDRAPLLKLHGTLSEPASIVATVESVAKGLPTTKAQVLRALTSPGADPRLWFYIGASMRDRDIIQHIGAREFAEGTSEWWVGPTRDRSVERFIRDSRDSVWRDLDLSFGPSAKCITTTADIFMGELRSHLAQS
jgi:hypothetical protein